MTTIAYRDGVLAADTLVTEQGRICGHTKKIRVHKGVLWGTTGCLIHQGQFDSWMLSGMRGAPPSMKTEANATSSAILIADQHLLTFDDHGWDAMPLPEFYAVGSGGPIALGAMAAGASAAEAVACAARFDVYSGGSITELRR